MLFSTSQTRLLGAIAIGAIVHLLASPTAVVAELVESASNLEQQTEAVVSVTERETSAAAAELTTATPEQRLVIHLNERQVRLYEGEREVASYPVAIGRSGWETPTGSFQVFQMVENPSWRHPWKGHIVGPGPQNPLGLHWIGFWSNGKEVIGFHGTPNEDSVGQAVSHGCIRMLNADVAELFGRVAVGTSVTVVQ